MAGNNRRVNYETHRKRNYTAYEDGSAVRKIQELPEKENRQRHQKRRKHAVSRREATSVSAKYVAFLAVVCAAVSVLCVSYLREKATITAQYEDIAVYESQYNALRSDNDAKYNQVIGSVSMEAVKDAAENRLGMHYANEDQIIYYDLTDGSYVRQYKDVPTG